MLSTIIISRNESTNIIECLRTLRWCHQVILIDSSTDNTIALARKALPKITVVSRPATSNFSSLRNLGLKLAQYPWVLYIDADHRVTKQLQQEIIRTIKKPGECVGFRIRQLDWLYGKLLSHGETIHIYHTLLGRKNSGKWQGTVHEKWNLVGPIGALKSPLHHYPHPTLTEFSDHLNRWSTLAAKQFLALGEQPRLWKVIVYPLGKFFLNYVIRLGFLDGFPGLVMAVAMSWHSFNVRVKMLEFNRR